MDKGFDAAFVIGLASVDQGDQRAGIDQRHPLRPAAAFLKCLNKCLSALPRMPSSRTHSADNIREAQIQARGEHVLTALLDRLPNEGGWWDTGGTGRFSEPNFQCLVESNAFHLPFEL